MKLINYNVGILINILTIKIKKMDKKSYWKYSMGLDKKFPKSNLILNDQITISKIEF